MGNYAIIIFDFSQVVSGDVAIFTFYAAAANLYDLGAGEGIIGV
jgi:hypothetical protein